MTGTIRLTGSDLEALAGDAQIKIVVDPAQVEIQASAIREALHSYLMWTRGNKAGSKPSNVNRWAGAVSRWADEGIELLGGNPSEGSPERGDRTDIRHAASHLARRPLADDAGTMPLSDVSETEETLQVLQRCLRDIERLRALSQRTLDWTNELPSVRTPDGPRISLFRRLKGAFEALHGGRYVVSNRYVGTEQGRREIMPSGPALGWTRGLFKLMAEKAAKPGEFPEFVDLQQWAQKPDALAERIKASGGDFAEPAQKPTDDGSRDCQ